MGVHHRGYAWRVEGCFAGRMIKPDKAVYESMARIGFSEKPFVDFMVAVVAEAKDLLMYQNDETQLRILQGRAQAYSELLARIKEAPETLRKA